ncbi:MAG: anti-sigma regulatory factor [Desulfamplus sp.]|nr:anti-sigma regulatory factor [Desulfamplus sp.]MBF0242998.1 anti-sigma regulatory factor [Desulfamplus sp.]MBF0390377.1 anti-sigma regulatory factor [Desulfamplus sp.]
MIKKPQLNNKPVKPDNSNLIPIANFENVILGRQRVREMMNSLGFSLLDQTRIVTAVSELARNIVVHAGGCGEMIISAIEKNNKKGIECIFKDQGKGIADVNMALQKGFSTSNSLGLGLSGAKNLCQEFEINSVVGKGTQVTIREWVKR